METQKAEFHNNRLLKKAIISGSALCACLLLLSACGGGKEEPEEEVGANVEIVSITPSAATQTRELVGRVEQTGIAPLAPEVSGRLIKISILDGQSFKSGQVLAQIDPEPFRLRLQQANAQYQQLAQDLVRKRQLRDENILPQAAYEQLASATEAASAQRALASRDLRNTTIRAPFDGRLASRNVELWQTVQAGVPAFNLESIKRFDVSVDLPQAITQQLTLDDSLKATVWLPERPDLKFPVSYREHTTQGTGGSGIFRLVFSGPPPSSVDLLAGMAMRVRIETAANNVLSVPIAALLVTKSGSHQVWKVDPKTSRTHAVPVTVKSMQQGKVLIESNLQIGDKIVGAGSQFLHADQLVQALGQPK